MLKTHSSIENIIRFFLQEQIQCDKESTDLGKTEKNQGQEISFLRMEGNFEFVDLEVYSPLEMQEIQQPVDAVKEE